MSARQLKIELRPTAALIPYAKNARTHSAAHVDQIAASVTEFGWTNPVLIDEEGGIIAGHGRVMAAKKLGHEQVPTITLAGLTAKQRRAYVLADNKIALNAGWDEAMLVAELQELDGDGFDLGTIGFGEDELTALFARAEAHTGLTDPDEAPPLPARPVSAVGDLWRLGRHRVLCGDATSATDVARLLGAVKPHLMVTDPPYGVKYDAAWREGADLGVGKRSKGKVRNDDRADWSEAWALFPGSVVYVWHGGLHSAVVQTSLESTGFAMRAQVIWVKHHFVMSRGDYHWMHEPCWYAVKKAAKGNWAADRKQTTVWEIANNNSFGHKGKTEQTWGHSTQKPVECMRRPIENNSSEGQAVYDPFLGSGTTVIAAEMTARSCLGLEIDPGYCDVIVRRWQEFTGEDATLDPDGRTFAAIQGKRHKHPEKQHGKTHRGEKAGANPAQA